MRSGPVSGRPAWARPRWSRRSQGTTSRWRWAGTGRIVNPSSGRCLDATGVSFANGTRLQIWDCGSGANQRWTRG
ncbi:RICIN domain-containing protein [Streptosporangium sp. NBC_01756]|uniref:RICIN domain-containing protein n=1 Tax=Streptosporangium sp. NBC_01756 TaxID=2975950 RepID=UPI002DDA08E5|nr:RICIN domain-containing protein [Streptosporangium sp. NBC_01756]WSC86531.1 RICIN domain-containing protein [Streptosporangium sp. NBC_01756]